MRTLRTPDDRFDAVPDFPYAPRYCDVSDDDGGMLPVAWVQDGPKGANPVLMLHGEPSWSYLYRKMIPILVAAGHRVVCPDLVGSVVRTSRPVAKTTATRAMSNGCGPWPSMSLTFAM
jgi:haloalkane dehalogenase